MKKLTLLFLFFGLVSMANSQDNSWFTDISSEKGLEACEGSRVFCVDLNNDNYPDLVYDNDGDIDLMACTYTHRIASFTTQDDGVEKGHYSEILLNDGEGHFSILENSGMHEIVAYNGKISLPYGGEQVVFDYPAYFLNATGLSFLDYDYDGNIDAYISTWFVNYDATNQIKMVDILMKGNGDGTFTQITNSGIGSVVQPMYGVNVTDYNNDGWQDIVTSAYCRSGGSIFENNSDGTFTDVAKTVNYSSQLMGGDHGQAICQWEALPADYDNDGDMDLLQINVHGGFNDGEGHSHISYNKGELYNYEYVWDLNLLERDVPINYTHEGSMGGTWIDLDNDMLLDALICQSGYENAATNTNVAGQTRTYVNKQYPDGTFKEITDDLGMLISANRPHSAEPCDFDLDGDNDIFLSRTFVWPGTEGSKCYQTVWQNNIADASFWTSIKVIAPEGCNKSAIGARITTYSNGVAQIREVQSGLGHFGNTQALIKNFGLANVPAVDSINVRFPMANFGDADLTVTSISITDPTASFTLVGDYPEFTLAPNTTKEVTVTFVPNSRIDFSEFINIECDAYNNEAGLLGLLGSCYKAEPVIAASMEEISFGTLVNDEHKDIDLVVTNYGLADLEINDISFDPEFMENFQVLNDPKTATITTNESYTYNLRYAPQVEYDRPIETTMTIFSNANNDGELEIAISAYGITRKARMAITNREEGVVFPDTELNCSCEEPLIITSEGDTDLVIEEMTFRFDSQNAYDIKDYDPPYTIATGETYEFKVVFTPPEEKSYNRQLQIQSNNHDASKVTISVRGTGIDPEGIKDVAQVGIDFTLYPNPIQEKATLNYVLDNTLPGDIQILIFDYLGNLRKEITPPSTVAGEYSQTVDFTDLPNGAYILRLQYNQQHEEKTIIINR
ncbi:MAG: hypothetical protein B7C24_18415 [Bacteroidetes bacterium 4572_77]|nr:MAG: hypothetical protein B7C24_18415 [Bacteroidetes bacterium 4572_77]